MSGLARNRHDEENSMFPVTEPFDRKTVKSIKRAVFHAKLAYRNKFLVTILDKLGNRLKVPKTIADLQVSDLKYAPLANLIPENPADTGYTGDHEIMTFLQYRSQLRDERSLNLSESRVLYEKIIDTVSDVLESSIDIKTMVNFGVSYAYIDSVLARRFPQVQFVGVDRSPFTKALNEVEFSEVPNMHFFADDIFRHLKHNSYSDGLFFHSRIGLLLNRPTVENIYRTAFNAGFKLIIGFEQFGLSRETVMPFTFSLRDTGSVHFRGNMFIHNYPSLLLKAGYRLEMFEIFKTGHPAPDFRIAAFVARKDPGLHSSP
jgi:hypothetical protein